MNRDELSENVLAFTIFAGRLTYLTYKAKNKEEINIHEILAILLTCGEIMREFDACRDLIEKKHPDFHDLITNTDLVIKKLVDTLKQEGIPLKCTCQEAHG